MTRISERFAYLVLSAILVLFAVCILWNANWLLGDDMQFLLSTAIGKPLIFAPDCGRFRPLGLFDYSILVFFPIGSTATAHLAYNCVLLVASIPLFFNLLCKLTSNDRLSPLISIFVLLFSASFLHVHMECIFTERMLFVLSTIFLSLLYKAEKSNDRRCYLAAFFVAVYMTYMKEPVFGALATLSLTRLVFGWRSLNENGRIFYGAILLETLIFVAVYFYVTFLACPPDAVYSGNMRSDLGKIDFFLMQITDNPTLGIILPLCIARVFFVVVKGDRKHLFTDAVLFSGGTYWIAAVVLQLVNDHQTFPAIFSGIPSLTYWMHRLIGIERKKAFLWLGIILLLPFAESAKISYLRAREILILREKHPKTVAFLCREAEKEKKIFFAITELNKNENFVQWKYRVYSAFLQYFSKRTNLVIEKISEDELRRLDGKNSVLLFPAQPTQISDFSVMTASMGLTMYDYEFGTAIYIPTVSLY